MDAVRIIVVSEELDTVEVLMSKSDLLTLLHRALNTWSDIPPTLLAFSDQLEKL